MNKSALLRFVGGSLGFFVPNVVNLLLTPVALRALGKEGFGITLICLNLAGLFAIANLLVDHLMLRFVGRARDAGDAGEVQRIVTLGVLFITGASLILLTAGVCVAYVLAAAGVSFTSPYFSPALLIAAAGLFCTSSLQLLCSGVLIAFGRVLAANVLESASMVASWTTALVFIHSSPDPAHFLSGRVYGSLGAALLSLFVMMRIVGFRWSVRGLIPRCFPEMIAFARWGGFARLSGIFTSVLDRTIVAALFGPSQLTVYQLALQLAPLPGLFAGKVLQDMVPKVAAVTAAEGPDATPGSALEPVFARYFRMNMALVLCGFLPLFYLGPVFMKYWVGADLAAEATPLLRLALCGYTLQNVFGAVPVNVEIGSGRMKFLQTFNVTAGVASLAGSTLLASLLGPKGAAGWQIVASGSSFLLLTLSMKRRKFQSSALRLVATAALGTLLSFLLGTSLALIARPFLGSMLHAVLAMGVVGAATLFGSMGMVFGLDFVPKKWRRR